MRFNECEQTNKHAKFTIRFRKTKAKLTVLFTFPTHEKSDQEIKNSSHEHTQSTTSTNTLVFFYLPMVTLFGLLLSSTNYLFNHVRQSQFKLVN